MTDCPNAGSLESQRALERDAVLVDAFRRRPVDEAPRASRGRAVGGENGDLRALRMGRMRRESGVE